MLEKTLPKSLRILYNSFKNQNIDKGHFDIEFHIGENILYAHKTILWPVSRVFEQMFHGAWDSKRFITITNYSYEDFKEFLTYFYIEKCKITNENIVSIVDLSEYYHVESLKEKCDIFLSKMEIKNIFDETILWYEFSQLYSLKLASRYFLDLLRSNICDLIENQSFLNAKKETIKAIVSSRWLNISEELLFDAILKWANHQIGKQPFERISNSQNEKQLRHQLSGILPLIRFPIMEINYLEKNQAINILFDKEELKNIFFDAKNFSNKTITNASKYSKSLRCWR